MDVKNLLAQMTLEEKAAMCSGRSFWELNDIERLGIPSIVMTDGPHGLRLQRKGADHLGLLDSEPATCFPTASAVAASFDRELIHKMGQAIARECQAHGVSVILGPGANIKRSPLCGRNFEYFSEDPYLSAQMAKGHIQGVQSGGVGTSLKHFAVNNQEYRRMTTNAIVDERALHEVYLASFEAAVREAQPWTVMCSYNHINGVYASESWDLLTGLLRENWGFEGLVVSDWGAVSNRVAGVKAGMDLEMPSSHGAGTAAIIAAVQSGELKESALDTAVENVLNLIDKALKHQNIKPADMEKQHEVAREIAAESAVLLKNDGILPLDPDKKIALIGAFAQAPRFQGGGSSHIKAFKVSSAHEAMAGKCQFVFEPGYEIREGGEDQALLEAALEAARAADVAVVFAGLPDVYESEGYDRKHLNLPQNQTRLIHELAKVQKNLVVVLHNGSPVAMPWLSEVSAVLEMYLAGQAGGQAAVDLLFGKANPCGKLAETFPLRLEDTSCWPFFGEKGDHAFYNDSIFVGYRHYDSKDIDVLFPFGFGLSYTQFEYANLKLDKAELGEGEKVTVSVQVKNTGKVAGKEIVQLYVSAQGGQTLKPVRELKGFAKVLLKPGEEKTVHFELDSASFRHYETRIHGFMVEAGDYLVEIGKSSRDIVLSQAIKVQASQEIPLRITMDTPLGDLAQTAKGRAMLQQLMAGMGDSAKALENAGEGMRELIQAMMKDMPLRALLMLGGKPEQAAGLRMMVEQANQ